MQKLTNKEQEIMHILWKLKKAFVKEVMAEIIEGAAVLAVAAGGFDRAGGRVPSEIAAGNIRLQPGLEAACFAG